MKKYYTILGGLASLAVLSFFILFTEEKQDDIKEVTYWKLNFDRLVYLPPSKENDKYEKSIRNQLILKRLDGSLRDDSVYTVENDKFQYLYEGGYHAKNLFAELSVLRSSMVEKLDTDLYAKFEFDKSMQIHLYTGSTLAKKIEVGKKTFDDKFYYITDGQFILKLLVPIIDRFTQKESSFRENRLVQTHGELLTSFRFVTSEQTLWFENKIEKQDEKEIEKWFIRHNGKTRRVNPKDSALLSSIFVSTAIDRYPEDIGEDGFSISTNITSQEPNYSLDIEIRRGKQYHIQFFPVLSLGGGKLIPLKKTINKNLQESVSYIKQTDFDKLLALLMKIEKAPEWKENL
jgi:hypothetical protein